MAHSSANPVDASPVLRSLMDQASISSYRALSQASGVPRSAIDRLRQGQVGRLKVATTQRLSAALGIPLVQFIDRFVGLPVSLPSAAPDPAGTEQIKALRQECDRLRSQLDTQADALRQQLQQDAIAQLEPWLVQWPTAAHAAQQRDDLPAHRLIPLVRPVEALVQQWGVTSIETVGAEVPFDPRLHQPKAGCPAPGQRVRVTHVGYRQGDRLLHRARVTPVDP